MPDRFLGSGNNRHSGRYRHLTPCHLVPEPSLHLGRGSYESNPSLLALLGECRVLGKETVARMDSIDFHVFGQGDDLVDPEVGFDRTFPLADQVSLICLVPMEGKLVLL